MPKETPLHFTKKSIDFLLRAEKQKSPDWLDKNRKEFLELIVNPTRQLVAEITPLVKPFARGYRFPARVNPRLKRSDYKTEEYGKRYRNYVQFSAERPSASRFDNNPSLYFTFSPEWILAGAGLYMPSSRQTKQLREWFASDATDLKVILKDRTFKKHFPEGMNREKVVKTKPRAYAEDHPEIEFLKLQAYFVTREYKRAEFLSPNFSQQLAADWKQGLRFNEVLYSYLSDWPEGAAPARNEDEDEVSSSPTELWDDRL